MCSPCREPFPNSGNAGKSGAPKSVVRRTQRTAGMSRASEITTESPRARPVLMGPAMQTFQYNGDTYPMPEGWHGLSVEDWFYKLESLRDKVMHADEQQLEPICGLAGREQRVAGLRYGGRLRQQGRARAALR
jgi:hypothetical protein